MHEVNGLGDRRRNVVIEWNNGHLCAEFVVFRHDIADLSGVQCGVGDVGSQHPERVVLECDHVGDGEQSGIAESFK